jgi:hypothetical protein
MINDLIPKNFPFQEIISHPENYPQEMKAAVLDIIKYMEAQIKEAKTIVTGNIIEEMQKENATKILFKGIDGKEKVATLKMPSKKLSSKFKDSKVLEEYIKKNGFTPEQLGSYEFVPFSWSKMKEIRKLGGEIQALIDELYVEEGKPTLTIGD